MPEAGRVMMTLGAAPILVPLVSRDACARCHELARATDPAWACFAGPASAAFSLCFDEHRRPAERLLNGSPGRPHVGTVGAEDVRRGAVVVAELHAQARRAVPAEKGL